MNTKIHNNPRVPRSVLIVEDDPTQRDMLQKALSQCGFTSHAVASGEAAIKALHQKPYTIALLDLNLPGVDGMTVFEQVREHWPEMSVVVLTGYGELDVARRAIRMDVVDFLSKPCPLGELELALARAYQRFVQLHDVFFEPQVEACTPLEVASERDDLNLESLEKDVVIEALKRAEGNRNVAAEALGISVRTLYYRLARYKLDPAVIVD